MAGPPRPAALRSDRLWQLDGWTARVIKNEADDGWAVEMLQDGEAEPALVGPWTMGRDKKYPKPLDQAAFSTLVKTASEVLQRHRQQAEGVSGVVSHAGLPDEQQVGGDDVFQAVRAECARADGDEQVERGEHGEMAVVHGMVFKRIEEGESPCRHGPPGRPIMTEMPLEGK